jgi:hypothetical protein
LAGRISSTVLLEASLPARGANTDFLRRRSYCSRNGVGVSLRSRSRIAE